MKTPRLSFCIPTYNFGHFIGETLESIVSQAPEEVEIVVVDGASTDDTESIVRGFQTRFGRLTYHRAATNGGVDRDLAKALELARGDYCWLMSSDDLIAPGAVSRMLAEVDGGNDIYLCNRIICSITMRPMRRQYWMRSEIEDRQFDLSQRSQLLDYLDAAESLGALFSFISTVVVRRQAWCAVGWNDSVARTHYAHVARLLAIGGGPTVKYISDALASCRTGNDSFLARGPLGRLLIDLEGYQRIGDSLYRGDALVHAKFLAVMRREHGWRRWVGLRIGIITEAEWRDLAIRLRVFGYDERVMRLLDGVRPVLGAARFIWKNAKRIRDAFARQAGSGRLPA